MEAYPTTASPPCAFAAVERPSRVAGGRETEKTNEEEEEENEDDDEDWGADRRGSIYIYIYIYFKNDLGKITINSPIVYS